MYVGNLFMTGCFQKSLRNEIILRLEWLLPFSNFHSLLILISLPPIYFIIQEFCKPIIGRAKNSMQAAEDWTVSLCTCTHPFLVLHIQCLICALFGIHSLLGLLGCCSIVDSKQFTKVKIQSTKL